MMPFYDRLLAETRAARNEFLAIPLIDRAMAGDVSRALYVAFLEQAYHHVRHTCPLLARAAELIDDDRCRRALLDYVEEERGHERWILADIAAMTGRRDGVVGTARPPCRAMVAYAYYAIEHISPYSLFGMVHVLEGMSTQLATRAAVALRQAFGLESEAGFSYLASHGAIDVAHVQFFRDLINGIDLAPAQDAIIDGARMIYWMYGNIFCDLGRSASERLHANAS